jgi:hypothetical protein
MRILGSWWPDNIAAIDRSQWRLLLLASVKLLQTALDAHFRPSLCSSLIWISKERPVIIPVCAVPAEGASQVEVLHDLAAVLLSGSTGIDMDALGANSDKLVFWNKSIPSDVLDCLIGCLKNQAFDPVSGFDELDQRLAVNPQIPKGATVEASACGGLHKIAGMGPSRSCFGRK